MKLKLKNGESVIIREALAADASEVLEFVEAISGESDFLTFGPGEFVMSLAEEEKFLANSAHQYNALYLVAEINDKIIGTASFFGGARVRISHVGEISVSVLKEYWGNGIATELLKYMIDWCQRSGVIRKLNLRVRNDNLSAIHLYKKLGFVAEGITTRQFQINGKFYDALLMGYEVD